MVLSIARVPNNGNDNELPADKLLWLITSHAGARSGAIVAMAPSAP